MLKCKTYILVSTVEIKMPELCYAYLILITSFLNPLDCVNMVLNKLVNVKHAVLHITVHNFLCVSKFEHLGIISWHSVILVDIWVLNFCHLRVKCLFTPLFRVDNVWYFQPCWFEYGVCTYWNSAWYYTRVNACQPSTIRISGFYLRYSAWYFRYLVNWKFNCSFYIL